FLCVFFLSLVLWWSVIFSCCFCSSGVGGVFCCPQRRGIGTIPPLRPPPLSCANVCAAGSSNATAMSAHNSLCGIRRSAESPRAFFRLKSCRAAFIAPVSPVCAGGFSVLEHVPLKLAPSAARSGGHVVQSQSGSATASLLLGWILAGSC